MERVDNRAADPCSVLHSATRIPPIFILAAAYLLGVAWRSSYRTVPAWRRPQGTKASVWRSRWGVEGNNLEHGSAEQQSSTFL